MPDRPRRNRAAAVAAVLAAITLLGLLAGFSQIKTEGLSWQETHYLPRLEAIAAGTAPAPAQYRLLTNRAVLLTVRLAEDWGLPRPAGLAFIAWRLALNFAVLGLAYAFYRSLGIAPWLALLGLSALTWGMTQANYGSDLAQDASADIAFYLAAVLAIRARRYAWIPAITLLSALNRETAGLIPVMLLASAVTRTPQFGLDRQMARYGAIALAVYGLAAVAILAAFGIRPWEGLATGASPYTGFLFHNLSSDAAWGHSVGVLGIVPLLALWVWRAWPDFLRPIMWSVVPAWCLLHLFLAPLDQARVLLLPQALVFLPALLYAIQEARTPLPQRHGGTTA